MFKHKPITTGVVYSNVTQDSRVPWRRSFPGQPAMTEENSGRVWKTQQCRHRLDVMLAVNQVGRRRNRIEIVDDGNSRLAKLKCCWTKLRAVDNRRVSALKQIRGQLTDVKL